jgi:hypothetical protein
MALRIKNKIKPELIKLAHDDFVFNNKSLEEVSILHNLNNGTIRYYSWKNKWRNQRRDFKLNVDKLATNKALEFKANEKFEEVINIRDEIKDVIELGISVNKKLLQKANEIALTDPKQAAYIVNKIKDNNNDYIKTERLLLGESTDNIQINENERIERKSRLLNMLNEGRNTN